MVGVAGLFEDHVFAPIVILDVLGKFLIDSVHFAGNFSRIEEGIDKEVGKLIE